MNRLYEYEDMKRRAFAAIAKKTLTGEFEMAERFDLMVPDPHTKARHVSKLFYTLETFYHISVYDALREAHEITIPVGIIGMKSDILVPVEQATMLFDRLAGPKEIYLFEEGEHHSVYDEHLSHVAGTTIAWFDKYLPSAKS
jgi:esterase/lipase